MKGIFPALTATIMLMISSYAVCTAGKFKLVKQSNDISLYERWIPAKGGEKVRELKAVLIVNAAIRLLTNLLRDGDRGRRWNMHADTYQVLPVNESGWITYIRYGMPWPFDDQDCCLHYQLAKQSPDDLLITFSSISDRRFPANPAADRITGVRGEWLLEKVGGNKTKVTYTITTDRSRKVPRWVSDPVIHNNLFSTMHAFKETAEHHTKQ